MSNVCLEQVLSDLPHQESSYGITTSVFLWKAYRIILSPSSIEENCFDSRSGMRKKRESRFLLFCDNIVFSKFPIVA